MDTLVYLTYLGILEDPNNEYYLENPRYYNVGSSNYSAHIIQPWSIWLDYPELTSWDHDILKRILRTKKTPGMTESESRIEDYRKIIHICKERIRQLSYEKDTTDTTPDTTSQL